ncbi:MAG: glycosyltransferase family 1 protein [Desulfobacteraceae bacterium]|nr:MAG: glycosyltransferase family 1 protein [Desulfobacteraceae bacterium]
MGLESGQKAKRVLYVLNDASGGASMTAYQVIKNLPKDRIEPYVVCYPSGRTEDLDRFKDICMGVETVYMPWCTIPWRDPFILQMLIRLKRMLHSCFHLLPIIKIVHLIKKWKIDIVHSNTSVQIDAAVAAKLQNVPHIWHIRELIGDEHPNRFVISNQKLQLFFLFFSHHIICNSQKTAFCLFNPQEKRREILYNPIEADLFSQEIAIEQGSMLRIKWSIPENFVVIGMCAAIGTKLKRHEWFIEAAAKVSEAAPNVCFVLCGSIPEPGTDGWKYYLSLKQLVEKHNLSSTFLFTGYIADIPGMMNAIDILVHTSPDESFGRVIVEAMAAGKPVVGFDSGGISEIIEHERCGFLAPRGDVSAIASFVIRLVREKDLRITFGEQGKLLAGKNYSMESYVNRLLRIYQEAETFV